ncbi:hypothetical protein GGP62_003085 [Salinibacter ruber]|nr:hypothetical protein [Salinibacter ruber]MCS3685442.1 hypothetical protein [Salinibacter ruber]MCS3708076.1 hypothetical protein [Salinibacter ruber]MCS3856447.1 hypothetical protein [Salinibacter ruber]MCS4181600.1 hypothetical protein [Salinibacter ruber]
MPSKSALDEQGSEVPATGFNACYSAAVAADLFDGNPDVFSANVAPCGPCGGPAIGLGRFGRVYAMKANGYLSSERAADIVGVPVCDLQDSSCEGLTRLYEDVFLGLPAGRSCGEGEKKRA